MDIHVTAFAAAARHGSVMKAARSLSTVQSNVTTRIRLVETQFVTHRAQMRSQAVARLIDVITGERANPARAAR